MKLPLIFLLVAESLVCSSQKTNDSLILTEFKNYTIKLPDVQPGSLGILPFHTIRVWDARPDTSSISFYFPENSHLGKLNFKDGLADAFQKFALTGYYFGGDTLNDLLIIIKVFRVSDFANVKVSNNIVSNWFSGAVVSAELFLQNQNSFHALYKVDSIVLATRISESAQNISIDCFNTILIKAINNNLSKMHIGKSEFSYDDLKKHIDDFNNMPLLKDSVFKKGVYQNFSEFKANNPTIINYNLNKGELADEIMVTENNHTYPLQNYWGYCDGKNVYIRSSNNLFRLFRAGNTFNTRAVKSLTIQKSISELPLGSISTIAKIGSEILGINEDPYKIYKKSFQLDMQTGELF